MRLTSIESSFHPCNICRDCPKGLQRGGQNVLIAENDARSVGDSHPSCFHCDGISFCFPSTGTRMTQRPRQLHATLILIVMMMCGRTVHCITVYVFLGDDHALIDLVRYMHVRGLNNGDYIVIAVHDDPYDPLQQRYFNKCLTCQFLSFYLIITLPISLQLCFGLITFSITSSN